LNTMTQAESADQPALGPDGQLLDASKIAWYNDPDDPHPIPSTSKVQEGNVFYFIRFWRQLIFLSGQVGQRSRPIRATAGARLAEAIAAEKLDEYGSSCRRFIIPRDAKVSAKRKRPVTDASCDIGGDAIQVDTDVEDKTFAISVSEGGCNDDSSDSESDGVEIGNEEVCLALF
jgi:hypothetical protein